MKLSPGSILRTVSDGMGRVLSLVGERWALLVVREVSLGLRRFNELEAAIGAPRTVLSDRLRRLTEAGILATRPYQVPGNRVRTEYVLTDAGVDLVPLLSAMSDWGERHLDPGAMGDIVYRHAGCGGRVTARLVCECGEETGPRDRLVAEVNR
jgi:DNA-binding HxlR family transcriptional regulator